MRRLLEAIDQREFSATALGKFGDTDEEEGDSALQKLNTELTERLKAGRENVKDNAFASLCWAIAVDAALLDRAMRQDAEKVFSENGAPVVPLADRGVHLYRPASYFRDNPGDPAIGVFNDYVRQRWPLLVFSLDPVTDQQNIADSFNLKRDLQLALSFAFATGQIGFNQLNTFRRQIEQSSDTIALNRTVTGFIHGNDIFGFRFTPAIPEPAATSGQTSG